MDLCRFLQDYAQEFPAREEHRNAALLNEQLGYYQRIAQVQPLLSETDYSAWLARAAADPELVVFLQADGTDGEALRLTNRALAEAGHKPIAAGGRMQIDEDVYKRQKLSYVKVASGTLKSDSALVNARTGEAERMGKLLYVKGKKQTDTTAIGAGDIGAVTKLPAAQTGDTLCEAGRVVKLPAPAFPTPTLSMAIRVAKKGDEGKIGSALARLMEMCIRDRAYSSSPITSRRTYSWMLPVASRRSAKLALPITRLLIMRPAMHTVRSVSSSAAR